MKEASLLLLLFFSSAGCLGKSPDGTAEEAETERGDDSEKVDGEDHDASEDTASSCVSNGRPTFSRHVTDLERIAYIIPLGSIGQNFIKDHVFLKNRDGETVPVHAPVEATLRKVAYYRERTDGVPEYYVEFQASCEVFFYFDHLVSVNPTIAAVMPAAPETEGMHPTAVSASVIVSAGDLIGTAEGTLQSRTWDFGVYNTSKPLAFANPDRWKTNPRTYYCDCPFAYFSETMEADYKKLFGFFDGVLYPGTDCGSANKDVIGTLSGAWFERGSDMMDQDARIVVASQTGDSVRVGGLSGFKLTGSVLAENHPTVRPQDVRVGQSICYDDDTHYAYFNLVGENELQAIFGNGNCPSSFPAAGFKTYER